MSTAPAPPPRPLDSTDVSPALSLQYCERAYSQSRGNDYWTKVLSLITGLGNLSYQQVKTLALRVGMLLVISWGLALKYGVAISLPFANASLGATLSTASGRGGTVDTASFNISDMFVQPAGSA